MEEATSNSTKQEQGTIKQRLTHIDTLRGIAVLLMVMVHAAATWSPNDVSETSILGYIVAGLGGLAAPLFVTLAGWGLAKSSLTSRKIIVRSTFFFIAQYLTNLFAGHLFEPFTPGVLSLFALLTLTAPIWLFVIRRPSITGAIVALLLIPVLPFAPFTSTPLAGVSEWLARVQTPNIPIFLDHLFFDGLYPFFPWVAFAMLGAMIASYGSKQMIAEVAHLGQRQSKLSLKMRLVLGSIVLSSLVTLSTMLYSAFTGRTWAAPTDSTGEALLTFFPANPLFMIAAFTGVMLIWALTIKWLNTRILIPLGRRSLTIYLLHFLPLGLFHTVDEQANWGFTESFAVVIGFTLLWIPLAKLANRLFPNTSLEYLLMTLEKTG